MAAALAFVLALAFGPLAMGELNASEPVRISDIQGAAHLSSLVDARVERVPGIVTAVRPNGFWFQDPMPDRDAATSEGLFVFTSSPPTQAVGDSILVSGTVQELRPGGASSANLTVTQLNSPTVVTASSGSSLPPATAIGVAGRLPPTKVIEDDADGSVEGSGAFDPRSDGIDFYESLEGMLVRIRDAVAVGPSSESGEITVVGDGGAKTSLRSGRGGIVVRPGDFNPERVILDDALAPVPAVNVGDRLGSVTGVLDYSFGNFKLALISSATASPGGLTREVTAPAAPGELAIASFNVENLDPGDGAAKFDELARLIVNHLQSPDSSAWRRYRTTTGPRTTPSSTPPRPTRPSSPPSGGPGGPNTSFARSTPWMTRTAGSPGATSGSPFCSAPTEP